jgi:mannose-6-phosphate isomerase-like protein (cupin superfamily)
MARLMTRLMTPCGKERQVDVTGIRRVVTGHDADGKAIVVRDGRAANTFISPARPHVALTDLWAAPAAGTEMDQDVDPVDRPLLLHPPEGGTVFRIVQFDPEDPAQLAQADGTRAFAGMGAGGDVVASARHPYMHRTETIDYAVVLSGSITMMLDEQDVQLQAGDVVVQDGTNHAWSNRTTEPCRIAFVLVDRGSDRGPRPG